MFGGFDAVAGGGGKAAGAFAGAFAGTRGGEGDGDGAGDVAESAGDDRDSQHSGGVGKGYPESAGVGGWDIS